jgi:hypothetical protein
VGNISHRQAGANAALLALLNTPLAAFRCPSDIGPPINTTNLKRYNPYNAAAGLTMATSNYVGNNTSWDLRWDGNVNRCQGVFIQDTGTGFRDIIDGTSNVIAVGERRWQIKQTDGSLQTIQAAVVFGIPDGLATCDDANNDKLSATLAAGMPKINRNSIVTPARNRQGYSSQHPGGAMFCMSDASVQFISETIQGDFNVDDLLADSTFATLTTWEGLLAIQDGTSVTLP